MLKYLLMLCGAFADMINRFKGFNSLAMCVLLNATLSRKENLGWLMHDVFLDFFNEDLFLNVHRLY